MIYRLTNGAQTLEISAPAGKPTASLRTYPAGVVRELTARGVERVLRLYRRNGWVDPDALALRRAQVASGALPLATSARADPALTAALVRQVLAEAPGRNRAAAAALLRISHVTLRAAIQRHLPALRAELDADPTSRGGGWREGHASRRAPEKSTET